MTVYMVVLVEPSEAAWQTLGEAWPHRHCIVSDRIALVAPEGIATMDSIQKKVGIAVGPTAPNGIVVPLDRHVGVLTSDVVGWIREAAQRG